MPHDEIASAWEPDVPPSAPAPPETFTPVADIEASGDLGLGDRDWDDAAWREFLESLVLDGIVSWREAVASLLGQLNPPQVGTQIASAKPFQLAFQKEREAAAAEGIELPSFMQMTYQWLYNQQGRCIEPGCGTRLDLQADHINPRQHAGDDPLSVERLDNLTLRCRRHNVIRRDSHSRGGGRTFLTAEAGLMWILLSIRPRTFLDFKRLCRRYGMTMSDVRFNEAWAMALWLEREGEYEIDAADYCQVEVWRNQALTRRSSIDVSIETPGLVESLQGVSADDVISFLTAATVNGQTRRSIHQLPVRSLPFSTYNLGGLEPHDLAILPMRVSESEEGVLKPLRRLPPVGLELLSPLFIHPATAEITIHRSKGGTPLQPTSWTYDPQRPAILGRRIKAGGDDAWIEVQGPYLEVSPPGGTEI